MIYKIGKEKLNLILSSGMSNIEEIEMALKFYLYGISLVKKLKPKILNH